MTHPAYRTEETLVTAHGRHVALALATGASTPNKISAQWLNPGAPAAWVVEVYKQL